MYLPQCITKDECEFRGTNTTFVVTLKLLARHNDILSTPNLIPHPSVDIAWLDVVCKQDIFYH